MPGKRDILSVAISTLLVATTVEAAPLWECRPTTDGGWECFKEGVLVPPQPVTAVPPATPVQKPKAPAAATPAQPAAARANESMPKANGVEQASPQTATTTPPERPAPKVAEQPTTPANTVAASTGPDRPAPEAAQQVAAEPAAPDNRAAATNDPAQPAPKAAQQVAAEPAAPDNRAAASTGPGRPASEAAEQASGKQAEPTPSQAPAVAVEEAPKDEPSQVAASDTPAQPAMQSRIDRGLNWAQCGPHQGFAATPLEPTKEGLTHISSDDAKLLRQEEKSIFRGKVEVRQGDQLLEAGLVEYNHADDTLTAEGEVYYEQPGLRLTGEHARMNLGRNQGQVEHLEYRLLNRAARGSAAAAEILDSERSHYKEINYTTCRPGNSDWTIKAAELEVDKASGVGTAQKAKVLFKGIPLFYAPSISFPIDDRRKSGFLIPSIGSSSSNGIEVATPYYFNIAPNMDATLTPRIMSRRGLMLGGEFRYLTKHHEGKLKAEILPSDSASSQNSPRGAISYQANGEPAPNWRFEINLNHVSDNDYLNDLGESLATTSAKNQERRVDLRYYGKGWNILGRLQNYQSIDRSITNKPYARLPQILLNLEKPGQAMGLTYHLRTEYVNFDQANAVSGQRFDLRPAISLPLRSTWGYLTPRLSARYTSYSLNNQAPGLASSPSRTLGTFSLDSGLFFEREAHWFGNAVTQTLEPRLFYLYTPYKDQRDLPDFDTAELDFSFANLFRENRFSGVDKVGDANQLTLALTSRNLDSATGKELLQANIGQIFYFRDRQVQLASNTGVTGRDSSSAMVAEVSARLNQNWHTRAGIQWNPHRGNGKTEKSALALHYRDQQRLFNLSYRYSAGNFEQTDLSASWPLSHAWSLVGRWNYSLMHKSTMEAFGGIEYDSCCWTTRLVARQLRTDANADPNLGIFLQLELKGLTSLGDRIDQFLERGILGYQSGK